MYKTKDLNIATALLCKGAKMAFTEKKDLVTWFFFEDPEKCEKIENDFKFGELLVDVKDYIHYKDQLMNKIRSTGENKRYS